MRLTTTLCHMIAVTMLLVSAPAAHADDAVLPNPKPQWYKVNLHTLTLWSDGNDFPDMVAEWYRAHASRRNSRPL
jgi:hypothetical protein